MEVNKEEALRSLTIAQKHLNASNLPSALKFAKKSISLYSTPEGVSLLTIIEREIETGGSASTPPPPTSSARASGVEEHVTSAKSRAGHHKEDNTGDKGKGKREYTAKQMEVVVRVKKCKHHEYYEILALERKCTENDVKKAYKKLALALHPDKNGAPGADEAFKMVSKAFQILSDSNMRAAYDSNPHQDPSSRGGGGGGGGGGGMYRGAGGGMPQGFGGFQGDINPEDLFNAFFGGGGFGGGGFGQQRGNVFTFGGPGGFQAHYGGRPRRAQTNQAQNEGSPLTSLIPIFILIIFALVSILPNILSTSHPDPAYSFEPTSKLSESRKTFHWGVPYYVEPTEWANSGVWTSVPLEKRGAGREGAWSGELRSFERSVESVYVRRLQNDCENFESIRQQRINQEAGFFGFGADFDKIRELRKEKNESCEQLKKWGVGRQHGGATF